MKWVLIVMSINGSLTMHDFESEVRCERAAQVVTGGTTLAQTYTAICIKK